MASMRDRSGVDSACNVVLYSESEGQAALDATHPGHLRVQPSLPLVDGASKREISS